MKITLIAALAGAAFLIPAAASAHNLAPCMSRAKIVADLGERFGEELVGHGTTDGGELLVEMLRSPDGSWTIIVSNPSGRSCALVSGDGWRDEALPVPDQDPEPPKIETF